MGIFRKIINGPLVNKDFWIPYTIDPNVDHFDHFNYTSLSFQKVPTESKLLRTFRSFLYSERHDKFKLIKNLVKSLDQDGKELFFNNLKQETEIAILSFSKWHIANYFIEVEKKLARAKILQEYIERLRAEEMAGMQIEKLEWSGSFANLCEVLDLLFVGQSFKNVSKDKVFLIFNELFNLEKPLENFRSTITNNRKRKKNPLPYIDSLKENYLSELEKQDK